MVVFSTNQDEGDCELSSPFSGPWIQNTDKKDKKCTMRGGFINKDIQL
jgi:hypothetical protein